ncbi:pyrimidine utilization protein D [Roseococcus suduntuyensis]|uniref:Putative carbamate hydrolase RutD n=1 Tax=Roseococcus suduntuyensis TaxID=455361 RepID=A0A840AA77_9PROT|nr:pyrimidine utilization protein D [Roseococcus suduntuyensis]MBB3897403.1 aminoacrylate hydrolase [Roseococcus suduntuyensis]
MKYRLTGVPEGEVVILSAGLGGAATFWAPQVPALEQHFRVLHYDHRGTGANREALPDQYSIAHMARDVAEILDEAGIARAHVLGHALGGLVGLEMARRVPERVGKLVLVNAWAKADRHTARCFDVRLGILAAQGPAAYVAAQPLFLHSAAYASAHHEKILAEIAHGTESFQGEDTLTKRIAALRAFDATADLPRIMAPTLVAAAKDDLLVPWTASEALAAGLPDATLWLTDHGAHACTVEDPETFNPVMMAFLRG